MISDIRVFLCDDDHLRFFGEGPCRLLHLIEGDRFGWRAAAMVYGDGVYEGTCHHEAS